MTPISTNVRFWPKADTYLAGVKDHNANAHGFCASAKDSANFDLVNNC
jgi:hypothetical protein